VSVAPVVLGDHRAASHIRRGEQAGRAVAHVVMGYPRRRRGQDPQAGRGPLQRLDLAFLINRENQGLVRRMEIQAHDITDLLDELRVRRQLPCLHQAGLRPNARQIRETADWLIPVAAAIDRVDQCVSSPGPRPSSVLVMTARPAHR
jgi:hypothetical protein